MKSSPRHVVEGLWLKFLMRDQFSSLFLMEPRLRQAGFLLNSLCYRAEFPGHLLTLIELFLSVGSYVQQFPSWQGPRIPSSFTNMVRHSSPKLWTYCWYLSPEYFQFHILFITLFSAYYHHHYFLPLGFSQIFFLD